VVSGNQLLPSCLISPLSILTLLLSFPPPPPNITQSEISSEQLNAFITATGNEVEPYWPMLFSKFLAGKMEDLITSVGGGGGAAAPAGAAAAAPEAAPEAGKKEKKEEKEEDADLAGGMDMFGGGGDGY